MPGRASSLCKSAAVSEHNSITALTIEIGADLSTIVSCKGDGLLFRRHDGKSQGEGKDAKRQHGQIIRSFCNSCLNEIGVENRSECLTAYADLWRNFALSCPAPGWRPGLRSHQRLPHLPQSAQNTHVWGLRCAHSRHSGSVTPTLCFAMRSPRAAFLDLDS